MPFLAPFIAHATRRPDRPAAWPGDSPVSYGALLEAARRVGAGASAFDDPRRVGILLGNSIEFLEIFLGTVLAGGAAVILDPKWSPRQRRTALEMTTPDLLFADPRLLGGTTDRAHEPAPRAAAASSVMVGGPDDSYLAWKAVQAGDWQPGATHPDAPFLIGFTSGTTGRPKPFTRDQGSWCAALETSRVEFGIAADDRILVPGPLVHGLGLYGAVEALIGGATLHLLPRFDAAAAVDRLLAHELTAIVAVPTMLVALLDDTLRRRARLDAVRRVVSAGAKLTPTLRERLMDAMPAADIFEYYGASELSFVSVASSHEACPPASVGRAAWGVELSLRGPDGRPVQPGEVGEVFVRSAQLSRGYLVPHDGAGFRMVDGWATVGDRGRLDAAGFLYLVGREGDMLVTGGLNVYPAEIEAALQEAPGIEAAIVVGRPHPYWGEEICAVLRRRGAEPLSAAALRMWCRERLEAHKRPRRFFAMEAMPLTASGKIARGDVRDRLLSGAPELVEIA